MTSAPAPAPGPPASSHRVVARNTLMLMAAQVAGLPLSMLVAGMMGQYLGPNAFGESYLASSYAGFGYLVVEWGQRGVLPALVAQDRTRAGDYLGTGILLRAASSIVVWALISLGCTALGYSRDFQVILGLLCIGWLPSLVLSSCQDTIRGFERADVSAYSYVGGQLLNAALVIPVLLLGGDLRATMVASLVGGVLMVFPVWRVVRPAGVGALRASREAARKLLHGGTGFLFLGVVLALQPNVDAVFLSRYSSEEAVGWHAAAKKLVGVLIYPAGALIGALYPTLCRLLTEDREGYIRTSRSAVRASIIITVPLAIGCAAYAELGIRLFSKRSFGPAEANMRILSAFVLLVYITMVLGTCISAAGKQRRWAMIQFLCVGISAAMDPPLVRWFQQHLGNGGLGICLSTVASEILMVVAGVKMAEPGIFDRSVLRSALLVGVAGAAMGGTAWLLHTITPFVAAPIAVAAYAGVLVAVGGIEKDQLNAVRSFLSRKFARR
jgi:O-antigen/teichoic acid export membrane protein